MATTVSCTTVEPLLSICCSQLSGTLQGDQCVLSLANNPTVGGRFQGCAKGESSTCSDGSVHDGVSGGLGVTSPVTGTANATSAVSGLDSSSPTGTESSSSSESSGSASDSSSDSASPTAAASSETSEAATTSASNTAVAGAGSTSKGPQTIRSSAATEPSPSKTIGAATSSSSKATSGRAGASASPSPSSSARVERRMSVLALLGAVALAMLAQ